jgi:hypothetical protein
MGISQLRNQMAAKQRDTFKSIAFALSFFAVWMVSFSIFSNDRALAEPNPLRVTFLGVRLQNDNEKLEPTTDAERNRVAMLSNQFTSALVGSGKYTVTPLTDDVRAQVERGQPIGECGGCEATLGKQLGADRVAWVTVQKVSNLILNINVYMADVASDKMTFIKSVDVRGNTDESWSRSMTYLLNNYLLAQKS